MQGYNYLHQDNYKDYLKRYRAIIICIKITIKIIEKIQGYNYLHKDNYKDY